jgi:alpha,alpha-trehalase
MTITPLPALERFDVIAARLLGRRVAVFLDYDGTLTPTVDRPEWALLSEATRASLARLADRCPVAIVTGRDRTDVERLVGLDSVYYAGNHGFDIAGPGGLRLEHDEGANRAEDLDRAATDLERAVHRIPGARVERKRFGVAVHYRQAPRSRIREVRQALDDTAVRYPELRATGGKMVFELRPRVQWDKGRAVLWLLEALNLGGPDAVAVYAGDDETDEDAFRALRPTGVTILVGDAAWETAAEFRADDPGETQRLLDRLTRTLDEQD